jgi:Gamma tubulin complex component N-terminal
MHRRLTVAARAQVNVIPHSSVPLAPRVVIPPIPPKLPVQSFDGMSLELQEATIIEDILYVAMVIPLPRILTKKGFEGQYIRYHDSYDHTSELDRLAGIKWKIAPGLDPSLRDLTQNIIKIATWYGSVSEFVNVQSKPEFGVVNHALCAAIRKLLRVPSFGGLSLTIGIFNAHCPIRTSIPYESEFYLAYAANSRTTHLTSLIPIIQSHP